MNSHKQWLLVLLLRIIVICIYNKLAIALVTDIDTDNLTETITEKTIDNIFRELRKDQTTKDADIVIKMTRDFVIDMQQKMVMIKRIQRTYSGTAQFTTGIVVSEIMRRFKHMCDLYKQFATVRRYVYEKGLNQSMAPSPDVVIVYEIMLSDYNEILMQIELYKVEALQWKEGDTRAETRNLIRKQMLKFRNLPAGLKPPRLFETHKLGEREEKKKKGCGKWNYRRGQDYQQKWSGDLDGISLDNR